MAYKKGETYLPTYLLHGLLLLLLQSLKLIKSKHVKVLLCNIRGLNENYFLILIGNFRTWVVGGGTIWRMNQMCWHIKQMLENLFVKTRNRMHYLRILRFYGSGRETGIPFELAVTLAR